MRIPGLVFDLDPERLPWEGTRAPGISWIPLHLAAPAGGRADGAPAPADTTALLRMDPGSSYPPHRHVGVEEVLVLAGGYRDEHGEHLAGSYVRYPAGSEHAPVALGDPRRAPGPENPACVLFATARGGVEVGREVRAGGPDIVRR